MVSITRLFRRGQRRLPPDSEAIKIALLAAAATSPPLEASLLGTQPAPGARPPSTSPTVQAARAVRAQSIAYELHSNNGRYSSRVDGVALKNQKDLVPHPLVWAVIPLARSSAADPAASPAAQARFFAAAGDREGERLKGQLFRTINLPGRAEPLEVALLPLQWEEARTLRTRFPDLVLVEDGQVYRGSSPRSLFLGTRDEDQPKLVDGVEAYSLKMHLSADTYARLGGLGGNRDINFNDALFAAVLTHAFTTATKDIPLIEVQSEGRAVAATVGAGDDAIEIGAIFRRLTDDLAVPGFAFFSPTKERLPHARDADAVRVRLEGRRDKPRYLAADAIRVAMQKDRALSKEEAFLKLFVDPLCDVNFQLFNRGWSMELHPQNFLLKLDEKTGLTSRVVIRDLHGLGYSAAWRAQRGLPDQMALERLQREFPQLSQADLEGYFHRNGALRDRYKPEQMFPSSLDFFTSIFWYHLLDAVQKDGLFDKAGVTTLVEKLKDRVHEKAAEHGFDLASLPQPKPGHSDYWDADKNGVRGRILFRRAV
jgi:hypothetical protein